MAYVDYAYYNETFKGTQINEEEFFRLSDSASYLIDSIVYCDIDISADYFPLVQKAVCYQIELLNEYGGVSYLNGKGEPQLSSEHVGDYSISVKAMSEDKDISMFNGIAISTISLSLLEKAGLRNRWAYAYQEGMT